MCLRGKRRDIPGYEVKGHLEARGSRAFRFQGRMRAVIVTSHPVWPRPMAVAVFMSHIKAMTIIDRVEGVSRIPHTALCLTTTLHLRTDGKCRIGAAARTVLFKDIISFSINWSKYLLSVHEFLLTQDLVYT